MAIVRPSSRIYAIISGEHKGGTCVIFGSGGKKGLIAVILLNHNDRLVLVNRGELAQLDTPGWPEEICGCPYGLQEYFEKQKGNGSSRLRTPDIAQPRALKTGDALATGEIVIGSQRRGFNSSALIHLDRTGWVELAPRLPLALKGNKNYRLPVELRVNDRLVTGCLVVKNSAPSRVNWTDIFLDRESCRIEVPSCVPLALA